MFMVTRIHITTARTAVIRTVRMIIKTVTITVKRESMLTTVM
jgi:hypothetical protein